MKKQSPKSKRKVKSISHGWAKDDDPMYTNTGWNFIAGKNLNPHIKPKKEKGPLSGALNFCVSRQSARMSGSLVGPHFLPDQ